MNDPNTNKNIPVLPEASKSNIYPSILNMNPGTIYPDLSLSLGSSHVQQNNLSKRNQELNLSISSIKAHQSNQPHNESGSNDSVVTKSQKFFKHFKQMKKGQDNSVYSILDLEQDAKDGNQGSAHSRSQYHEQPPVEENRKLNMTQRFMMKFNNSKEMRNSQEDSCAQNKKEKKQRTIKVPFNQIQLDNQLTNVINKAKQQLKNDQQKNVSISYLDISDNLQSCAQEPNLRAVNQPNKQTETQNFKKATLESKKISSRQPNDQNESSDDGVCDEDSQEQINKQKVIDQRSESESESESQQEEQEKEQKIQQKVGRIERKQQLGKNQQVNRQRQQQWPSQSDQQQQQQQVEQQQGQGQEGEGEQQEKSELERKKSEMIGIRVYKSLTNQKIKELTETTEKYYPSNYFHAGPRHQMLGLLREILTQIQHLSPEGLAKKYDTALAQMKNFIKIDASIYSPILQRLGQQVRGQLTEDVIGQILNVISQYNCCNYFHVGPRRQMFSWVLKLISLVEQSRKKILQKSPKNPQGPNGLRGAQQEQQDRQQQEQQQQQQQQQEQEQEQQQQQNNQQDQFDDDDDDEQDDQDSEEANDVINNSIHVLFSNYANNDISFLSTQRSLNIQNNQPNSIKYSLEQIKNYQIGKKLKQSLTPTLIQSLGQTLMQYNSSNYFHVGPRYELLGFMQEFATFVQRVSKNGGKTEIDSNLSDILVKKSIKMGEQVSKYMTVGKVQQIVSTCQKYDSSNYFHVGPRYSIFGDVRKLISISQL